MRRYPLCVAAAAAAVGIAGCSSGDEGGQAPSATSTSTTSTSTEAHTPAPGGVEVSPDGVTTAIGAPAESTEEEYSKACIAAKTWMDEQGGDPKAQIEPYLKTLQSSDAPGPSTFGTPWSQLDPGRQAAVIVAVQAAADALCG
jgi:Putative lipoprotein LpqV